jgi:hypothetical protein
MRCGAEVVQLPLHKSLIEIGGQAQYGKTGTGKVFSNFKRNV